jgi:hypothetical protein
MKLLIGNSNRTNDPTGRAEVDMLRWNKWIGFGPTKGELTQLKKGKELGVPFWIYRSEGEYADKPGVIYKAKRILNISDLKPVKNSFYESLQLPWDDYVEVDLEVFWKDQNDPQPWREVVKEIGKQVLPNKTLIIVD